ncbi:MAG: efflux RND transporter periplasmic adaptor subunit [Bacteroidetes bacterium]|nr:efflux RND transporter periplasmic adaptor subunit [Bacteroidota bacterium]
MTTLTAMNKKRTLLFIFLFIIAAGGGFFIGQITESGDDAEQETTVDPERKVLYWQAPMNPTEIYDRPGKSAMGMDLVPVYEDESGMGSGSTISIDPITVQNMGVRTGKVTREDFNRIIRTVGKVEYDEELLYIVNTKISGWIEKLYVNYEGAKVEAGDPLLEIYSPELVSTQEEFLLALRNYERIGDDASPSVREDAERLLSSARTRLEYWDIPEAEIERLEQTREIKKTVLLRAPATGIVIHKNAVEGAFIRAGMDLYKIADLSSVWAEIEVFEYQIQFLELDQTAHITVDAFPGRQWEGKIIYIDPTVNAQTRTLKAHVEIPNEDRKLRPGMYANITIRVPAVSGAVKVPEEAILHTGERSVVIVAKGQGVFEPREVHLGAMGGGYREVRRGLSADEIVVVSSQFLIDSESSMKEAISDAICNH